MSENSNESTMRYLQDRSEAFRKSARRWKISYRLLLILSTVLSAAAALVVQLKSMQEVMWIPAEDLGSIFAALVAVISTVIAALDFESNWHVNRAARHEVDILLIELKKSNADEDQILTKMQKIIRDRVEGRQSGGD